MADEITEVLTALIAKQALVDPALITPESVLSDLGVTSLGLIEVIMEIEDTYGLTIQVDAVDAWNKYKTVGDLIALGHTLDLKRPGVGA